MIRRILLAPLGLREVTVALLLACSISGNVSLWNALTYCQRGGF